MDGYLTPAFGARSKSEVDVLVLEALAAAGALEVEGPIYDLVRHLQYHPGPGAQPGDGLAAAQWRDEAIMREKLIAALGRTRFAKDGTYLTFDVESPLVREEIITRLKREGVFADPSFSRELIRLAGGRLRGLPRRAAGRRDEAGGEGPLVANKQLPDHSFKALANGVLTKLGKKVAGKAGEAVAEQLVGAAGDVIVKPAAERMTSFLLGLALP